MLQRQLDSNAVSPVSPRFQRNSGYRVAGVVEVVDVVVVRFRITSQVPADRGAGICIGKRMLGPASGALIGQTARDHIGNGRSAAMAGDPDHRMIRVKSVILHLCVELVIHLAGRLIEALMVAGGTDVEVAVPFRASRCTSDGNAVQTILLSLVSYFLETNREGYRIVVIDIGRTAIGLAVIQAGIPHRFQQHGYLLLLARARAVHTLIGHIRNDNGCLCQIRGQSPRIVKKHAVVVHKGYVVCLRLNSLPFKAVAGIR